MRREIIQCEICKKEHDAQYELPKEWITTKQTGYPGNDIEQHFCSKACIAKWAGATWSDTSPTKMRRFLLVDGETADVIEGIQWSTGEVTLEPVCANKREHYFYHDWDDFKQKCDGSGIQWIDQEVASQDKGYPGYHPPRSTHLPMSITGLRGDRPLEIKVDQEVNSAD